VPSLLPRGEGESRRKGGRREKEQRGGINLTFLEMFWLCIQKFGNQNQQNLRNFYFRNFQKNKGFRVDA
jgi:hypothetical protein